MNNAVTPLLILEGEVLIGAKQDRIANTSLLIPPHVGKLIPVSCVEANRWEYQTNNFMILQIMLHQMLEVHGQKLLMFHLKKMGFINLIKALFGM